MEWDGMGWDGDGEEEDGQAGVLLRGEGALGSGGMTGRGSDEARHQASVMSGAGGGGGAGWGGEEHSSDGRSESR